VDHAPAPRVLLGNLSPIMLVGLRRVLAEDGISVIGQEQHASRIVDEVVEQRADVVVLDLNHAEARVISARVRQASPHTKVILWARDESVMEVLDPESQDTRLVAVTGPDGLGTECTGSRNRQRVEE
jgi:AmiR/NasT family two-component response regulator